MSDLTKYDLIPLSRAVKASLIDSWQDIGQMYELYTHWVAREFKFLNRASLKQGFRYCNLPVSPNTLTATLPLDFKTETGLFILQNGKKIPLQLNRNIVNSRYIETIKCEDKCEKCNQNKAICNDLVITETVNIKVINGQPYEETVIKKLHPNGDYYLQVKTPVWNFDASPPGIEYVDLPPKFIAHLDLKDCGCLDDSEANMITLQECCPDVFGCYYATTHNKCIDTYGGYNIFEENGLIQFDFNFPYSQVYLEYNGDIPKRNGTYYIPEVALDAISTGAIYRAMKFRRNYYTRWQIQDAKTERNEERSRLNKFLSQTTLDNIIDIALRTPQFNTTSSSDWYSNFCRTPKTVTETADTCV